MAPAESKSLIQKLSIAVVPLASKGLLRSEDVRLGEKVLVAGFPFGDFFSNSIKVTTGIVSATRGAGDDSGQFQLDAAVQPGNSGGPIYDSGGNIVGVVISQLDKLKVAKAIGSLPENVNFQIPSGSSFYIVPSNDSIESQKIAKMIDGQLQKKAYRLTESEDADIVIYFSAEMLGAKTQTGTISTPVQTQVYNPYTGLSILQTTGYKSQSYSTTKHQREIRIQFHDGRKLRAKEKETILWEAVGKSGGSSADIIKVAPGIISSIFEELGKDSDSKSHEKNIQ